MKVLVAGDYCPRGRVLDIIEKGDFETVFGEVKDIVSSSDYSIINFECPIVYGNPEPIMKSGPNLKCTPKGLDAIKWAGFKCVTLANNHIFDYGDSGVIDTLSECDKKGIDNVGCGRYIEEASAVLYKKVGEKKLAIVNCCEHEFSIATENSGGANPLNPIQQYYAIKEAKSNSDYVIVIVHGGHEHWQLPSPRMQEAYRFFVDTGADAVVNHHQHCFSGYEIYKAKPIFYGLGNFCFDGNRSRKELWHEGYMVMLSFGDNLEYELIPYNQCSQEPTVRILSTEIYRDRIEALNAIISEKDVLSKETKNYYSMSSRRYGDIFEPCHNKLYLWARIRGWLPSLISKKRKLAAANYILCESHRDKLTFWLNNY